jgi:hypothetical protein
MGEVSADADGTLYVEAESVPQGVHNLLYLHQLENMVGSENLFIKHFRCRIMARQGEFGNADMIIIDLSMLLILFGSNCGWFDASFPPHCAR